jgi:hypothetical protein
MYAINDLVLWLNTTGLAIGAVGAILLARFTRVFITIQPDGTQSWGPPAAISDEQWRARNIRLRRAQMRITPAAYICMMIGFCTQLLALWLPALVAACR